MPLSWNEIKSRTVHFIKEWENESRERAEKDTFWNEFFNIFGITRRRVATFEHSVKRLNNNQGYIDLFWPGNLLAEHKSAGADLDAALDQAHSYLYGLQDDELPKMIIVSDFQRFGVFDLEEKTEYHFPLQDLLKNIEIFGFIAGYVKKSYDDENPVNAEAAARMGALHDKLDSIGYRGHALEVYLVRLLFCLFADDTGIFERGIFHEYIDLHTRQDGSDLAAHLAQIFQTLNTPKENRLSNLNEHLNRFPYVNGAVFAEPLPFASFDSGMRQTLLNACALDWGQISPAIFGSMFQAAMNPQERRDLGAHYTSEQNIMKVIEPLFLDELKSEMKQAEGNSRKLKTLHDKIAELKFLDPACGSGNFLIIAYRELRKIELEILKQLHSSGQGFLNIADVIRVNVNQFYGIEYDEFPARIAEVAMWLMDHQMNNEASLTLGQSFVRLPLTQAAHIHHANALRTDWEEVVPKTELNYILGNPPFYGTAYQSREQKKDISDLFFDLRSSGMLDYVTGWYIKASKFIQGTEIRVAFVSTNSIVQGEQAVVLWEYLILNFNIHINFAHQTFQWNNEAKGNAAVHVVIIGFSQINEKEKFIFHYTNIKGLPVKTTTERINHYLIDAQVLFIHPRTLPLCDVPKIGVGSALLDGGHLILSNEEKELTIEQEPLLEAYIKPLWSANEFIKNKTRWCLWLKDIDPKVLRNSPILKDKLQQVREFRFSSKRKKTYEMGYYPNLFGEERQPETNFLLIPKVTSENREYIPIGYMTKDDIITDKVFAFPEAELFHYGILTSKMHMIWMKFIGGRLKSDYSYSNTLVYNNFPWPQKVTDAQKQKVEEAAQAVLDARERYPHSSLADLYDPLTMPPDLVKAHKQLDKAVDNCYRKSPFENEMERMEFLFGEYEKLIG